MDILPASPQLVQVLLQAAALPHWGPQAAAWLLPLAATALRSTFPTPDEALWLRARLFCMSLHNLHGSYLQTVCSVSAFGA